MRSETDDKADVKADHDETDDKADDKANDEQPDTTDMLDLESEESAEQRRNK